MRDTGLTKRKIKAMLRDPIVRTVLVSASTIIITLGLIFAVVWHYREPILKILASKYSSVTKPIESNLVYEPITEQEEIAQTTAVVEEPEVAVVIDPEQSVVDIVRKAKPAVVSIVVSKMVPMYAVSYQQIPGTLFKTPVYTESGKEKKQTGSGSGFFISSDGLIVTNRHVVSEKDAIYDIILNNGKTYTGTVLARDTVLDFALIKIEGKGFSYLELGDSDSIEVGESVIAIGNTLGKYDNTVSTGIVSGLSRSLTASNKSGGTERLDKVIQTDAAINPGNSGGPLINLKGKVIGINVAVVEGSSNVGFALPSNSVKSSISSVKSTGKIIRPYVGVRYIPITAELKSKNNLLVDYGIWVKQGSSARDAAIVPGSPAEKAGIKEGDIILTVDGQAINEDQSFSFLINQKKVGNTVVLRALSNNTEKTFTVKLEASPENL